MNILVTGGTGSFGQAFVEKLLQNNKYSRICIYSRGEHAQEAMAKKFNNDRLRFFIGDVRDKDRLSLAIRDVECVVHAAALKIVPAMEYNPSEAIKTNILGSQNVIEACIAHSWAPTKVIMLSTDKAVFPRNLYGATKLCAEKLFLSSNGIYGPYGPEFSVVRYGNVSNSNGSVIPLFKKQLESNEPLTVTHEDMSRFWISLDDAAQFVIDCLDKMEGGETFIPKMPSFKIMDLAKAMSDNIIITGIRPGEKLHEAISDDLTSDSNTWWLSQSDLIEKLGTL